MVLTKLRCAAGLADLATKKYKSAAKYFLLASFDHCDFPEVSQCKLSTSKHVQKIKSLLSVAKVILKAPVFSITGCNQF